MVSFGKRIEVRRIDAGLLLGVDPDEDDAEPAIADRYRQIAAHFNASESVSQGDIYGALALSAADGVATALPADLASCANVVLNPDRLTVQIAFGTGGAPPGSYEEIRLRVGAGHE